jgi:hypothetical protein
MKSEIDFEQILAEGKALKVKNKLDQAGRIDLLEETSYGTAIIAAREELGKMTGILGQELYINSWTVFESAYKRAWEKEKDH